MKVSTQRVIYHTLSGGRALWGKRSFTVWCNMLRFIPSQVPPPPSPPPPNQNLSSTGILTGVLPWQISYEVWYSSLAGLCWMKAAGNKFILEEGTCDSNMLKGSSEVISILLVCKRRKGDNARTASFFIIYCLVEAQPSLSWDGALSCNLGAPVTHSWKCWAGKSHTGVESAIRHLMLRIAVPGGFPALIFNFWLLLDCWSWNVSFPNSHLGVLVKRFPVFPTPFLPEILIQEI